MPGILLHSPAAIVTQFLIVEGYSNDYSSTTWPTFRHNTPDYPDNMIVVFNTSGIIQGFTQNDGQAQEQQGVQILVRSNLEEIGYTKIKEMVNNLDQIKLKTVTIDATSYQVKSFNRSSDILFLGKDMKNSSRVLHTVNYVFSVRKTS